jgi:hypothetical protein
MPSGSQTTAPPYLSGSSFAVRHRRRRCWRPLVAAALLAGVAGVTVSAQQQFQFFLSAANAAGARVTDLRIEEVAVAEGGRPARVVRLDPVSWPVKVTVMVDNGMGTGNLLVQYRNGLKGFFAALPTGVESSLLTLAPQPRWVVRRTNDRVQLTSGVDRISPDGGGARLLDALIEESDRIEKENRDATAYFPVVVIVSTTGPEGSTPRDRDLDRMVRQFKGRAARVHVIMLGTNQTSPNSIVGARQVQAGKLLADETGGRYEAIAAATRIATLLPEYGEAVADAHQFQSQQYLVTVERPAGATGALGELSMGLTRAGLTFAATPEGLMP